MYLGFWDINGQTHVYLGDSEEAMHAWARMMEDTDRRTVATDEINHVFVSTMFLGTDHSFGEGPPLLFETMAFAHDGGDQRYEGVTWRYATWDEAVLGHRDMCDLIRTGAEP